MYVCHADIKMGNLQICVDHVAGMIVNENMFEQQVILVPGHLAGKYKICTCITFQQINLSGTKAVTV